MEISEFYQKFPILDTERFQIELVALLPYQIIMKHMSLQVLFTDSSNVLFSHQFVSFEFIIPPASSGKI